MHTVYAIEFPNGKKYIGYTGQTIRRRLACHYYFAEVLRQETAIARALRKYERSAVTIRTLAEFETKREALAEEVREIAAFGTQDRRYGYNGTAGGESVPIGFGGTEWMVGKTADELARINRKKGRLGTTNPFFGRHHDRATVERAVATRHDRQSYADAGCFHAQCVRVDGQEYASRADYYRATGARRCDLDRLVRAGLATVGKSKVAVRAFQRSNSKAVRYEGVIYPSVLALAGALGVSRRKCRTLMKHGRAIECATRSETV